MGDSNLKLLNLLTQSGLTANQARVYLANLKLGQSSVWDIAEESGVKRTTCYVVLKELQRKGLGSSTKDSKRALYSVAGPTELYINLTKRQEAMKSALAELNALASQSPAKPLVRMFEGVEGMIQAYRSTLNLPEGSEILIYGNPEVYANYPDLVRDYVPERVKKRIRVRTIVPDTKLAYDVTRDDEKILRQTRVLPQSKFDQRTEVNILPNSIYYFAHSEKRPFATVLESPTLAREEKSRFELLWQISKKQDTI